MTEIITIICVAAGVVLGNIVQGKINERQLKELTKLVEERSCNGHCNCNCGNAAEGEI